MSCSETTEGPPRTAELSESSSPADRRDRGDAIPEKHADLTSATSETRAKESWFSAKQSL